MKMIIKNCPAITQMTKLCDNACPEVTMCKDISDCLLKRIVNECQEIIKQRQEIDFDDIWGHSYSDCELSELNGQCKMARKILRMLDIEECE